MKTFSKLIAMLLAAAMMLSVLPTMSARADDEPVYSPLTDEDICFYLWEQNANGEYEAVEWTAERTLVFDFADADEYDLYFSATVQDTPVGPYGSGGRWTPSNYQTSHPEGYLSMSDPASPCRWLEEAVLIPVAETFAELAGASAIQHIHISREEMSNRILEYSLHFIADSQLYLAEHSWTIVPPFDVYSLYLSDEGTEVVGAEVWSKDYVPDFTEGFTGLPVCFKYGNASLTEDLVETSIVSEADANAETISVLGTLQDISLSEGAADVVSGASILYIPEGIVQHASSDTVYLKAVCDGTAHYREFKIPYTEPVNEPDPGPAPDPYIILPPTPADNRPDGYYNEEDGSETTIIQDGDGTTIINVKKNTDGSIVTSTRNVYANEDYNETIEVRDSQGNLLEVTEIAVAHFSNRTETKEKTEYANGSEMVVHKTDKTNGSHSYAIYLYDENGKQVEKYADKKSINEDGSVTEKVYSKNADGKDSYKAVTAADGSYSGYHAAVDYESNTRVETTTDRGIDGSSITAISTGKYKEGRSREDLMFKSMTVKTDMNGKTTLTDWQAKEDDKTVTAGEEVQNLLSSLGDDSGNITPDEVAVIDSIVTADSTKIDIDTIGEGAFTGAGNKKIKVIAINGKAKEVKKNAFKGTAVKVIVADNGKLKFAKNALKTNKKTLKTIIFSNKMSDKDKKAVKADARKAGFKGKVLFK